MHCAAFKVCHEQNDKYRLRCAVLFAVVAFGLLAIAASYQPSHWSFTALLWSIIAAIDLYVLFLLICTSIASSTGAEAKAQQTMAIDHLPSRPGALTILFLYLAAFVAAFAALYLDSNDVARNFDNKIEPLSSVGQALYFSAVTMTTLGYGDFQPTGGCARLIVIFQLISGFLVLIAAIPLLIGRLTIWSDEEENSSVTISVTGLEGSEPFYTSVLGFFDLQLMHKGQNILGFGKSGKAEIWIKSNAKPAPHNRLSFDVETLDSATLEKIVTDAQGVCTTGELKIGAHRHQWMLVAAPNKHEIAVRCTTRMP
jgi:hypothetical protein